MAGQIDEYENITLTQINSKPATLSLSPNGIHFKETSLSSNDFRTFSFYRVANGYRLDLTLKNNQLYHFEGFEKTDADSLKQSLQTFYSLHLDVKELGIKGHNWGKVSFEGSYLVFNSNKPVFNVPLNMITNSNLATKNEVSIEFNNNTAGDALVEMRLYAPAEGEGDEYAGGLYETIKSKADVTSVIGEGIVLFQELPLLTPRGRYDVEMFSDFLRLRGKTYDYKLLYTSISRLFLLPKPDDIHVYFVIGCDPPLRQGQTKYNYLVLHIPKDEETEAELNIDEKLLHEKYNGKLQASYSAPTYEVVCSVFRGLTGRKVYVPGAFTSYHGAYGVKSSLKANEGQLFPLEKGFLFVPKPATFIPINEIENVLFGRVTQTLTSSKTFDMTFNTVNGQFQFMNINREEFQSLEDFLKVKKINFKNTLEGEVVKEDKTMEEDESEDDEDFVSESESDVEEEFDENYSGSASEEERKKGGDAAVIVDEE